MSWAVLGVRPIRHLDTPTKPSRRAGLLPLPIDAVFEVHGEQEF